MVCLLCASPANAIDVQDWNLSTRVENSANGQDDFEGSVVPLPSPFQEVHEVAITGAFASTAFDFFWGATGAQVNSTVEHAAAGNPILLRARSTGSIYITSQNDLLLTIDANYNYALGPGDRESLMIIAVSQGFDSVFFTSLHAFPIAGDPPVGSFNVNESFYLPAGFTYHLHYNFRLDSSGGSPEVFSFADGHANFSLVVVPDASTGALLAPAAFIVLRRRRHP